MTTTATTAETTPAWISWQVSIQVMTMLRPMARQEAARRGIAVKRPDTLTAPHEMRLAVRLPKLTLPNLTISREGRR